MLRVRASKPSLFFSLEMSSAELGLRLLCGEARADSIAVRRGNFNMGALMNAANRLRQIPLLIDDSSSLTVLDIQARTRRLHLQQPISLIVIDYLQLLRVPRHYQSCNQEITEISQGLKQLAKEFNIPVLVLSQLNRDIEKRSGAVEPQLSDLRDGGSIEQDSDVVMFLHRPKEPDNPPIEISVAKQRNGPIGNVQLVFHKADSRFDSLAASHHAMAS
jgi:replicative DNA helicase